jgi:hypothetical protein
MSEAASYLTRMARVIEDNVPLIRAEQSIQLQPIFQTMPSEEQQSVLDSESQAEQAILMTLAALNGQLEQMGEEVSDCPQEDKEADEPWYERNRSWSSTGGGSDGEAKTPEQRIEDAVGDPVLAELLIEQAKMKDANLEDVAAQLEKGLTSDEVSQLINKGDLPGNWQIIPHDNDSFSFPSFEAAPEEFKNDSLEANLYPDGEIQIAWIDRLSQLLNLRSLIEWLGDDVQSINAYVTDGFYQQYFSTDELAQKTMQRLNDMASTIGFRGTVQRDGARIRIIFNRIK